LRLAAIISALKQEVVIFKPDGETAGIFERILDATLAVMTYSKSSRCRRHEAWATPDTLGGFYDKMHGDLGEEPRRRGGTIAMYMGQSLWDTLEEEVDDLLAQLTEQGVLSPPPTGA
jgi:hypothetical protein